MPDSNLPEHVSHTVEAIEQLHVEHRDEATPFDRFAARAAAFVGKPAFVIGLTGGTVVWIAGNIAAGRFASALDPPPFDLLDLALAMFAVCLTLLILASQRRSDRLANHREQLTLQLALLNEQKSAKIIALIEEMRRDIPMLSDRHDAEAAAMAESVDPKQVSEAIKKIDDAAT